MDSLVCVSVLAFCVTLPSALADPEPGRAPKVYNALITSSQNLAPSKSFPLYLPVYEPYSLQFSPGFYYPDYFKSLFGESSPQTRSGTTVPSPPPPPKGQFGTPPTNAASSAPTGPEATVPDVDRQQDKPSTTEEGAPFSGSPQQPPQQPPTRSPIPLNEFGLPPAIVSLPRRSDESPTSYAYDPFAPLPYYPQFDSYLNSYSFQSYPLLPGVYHFPGQPQPHTSPPLQPSEASSEAPSVPPLKISGSPLGSTLTQALGDRDVKNYSKPDPSIPDVPPPPIPNGGLKDESPKTN